MTAFGKSLAGKVLEWTARVTAAHPTPFVYCQVLLAVVCVFYTAFALRIDTNRNNLIGPHSKRQRVFLNYQREFPGGDAMVAVVESANPERNREFVERLAARVQTHTNLFSDLFYKSDLTTLGPKALQLASTNDLRSLQHSLHVFRPYITKFTQATNLTSLITLVNKQFLEHAEDNEAAQSLTNLIPFLQQVVDGARQSIVTPGYPPPPGMEALLGGGGQEIYITYRHGRIFLLTARAKHPSLNPEAIDKMRELIAQTALEIPGVNAGLTGESVLELDEMRQSEHDSILASIVALVLCSAIFIVAYREVRRPMQAAFCLIVGLVYSLGFATAAVGHLNILTITFAPMLVGLGIDFGVHFISRYEEEQRNGQSETEANFKAMVFTGQGVVTGALTTAAAFLAMALTNFKGIREMGLISGGGLLLCLVPMMTLLPILLTRSRRPPLELKADRRVQIERLWLSRPWVVVSITLILCVVTATQVHKVYFDHNLLNMQSQDLPSVRLEKKLLDAAGRSLLFAAVIVDSPQQAIELAKKIKRLPIVESVQSAADFLSANPGEKLRLIDSIKAEVSEIHFAPPETNNVELEPLSNQLWYLTGFVGLGAEATADNDPGLSRQLRTLRNSIVQLNGIILGGEPEIPQKLAAFQQSLFREIDSTFSALREQDASSPLGPGDLPSALRDQFVSSSGKYLLQVYARTDLWHHANQRDLIRELESVVPEDQIAGTPVGLYEHTTLLKESYQQAAWYALAAIAIMIFLHFRSFLCVVLSLLPVGVGMLWLLGVMGANDVPFNPANIMTLPLVIGIGVTSGIQILNRVAEEGDPGILSKSTGKAVLVSGLTAIAGFGSLILAKHEGIRSLGIVMSVGIACCMVAGLTLLPSVLQLLYKRGWRIQLKGPR